MTMLSDALHDWGTASFSRTLCEGLKGLESGILPLDQGVYQGGFIDDSDMEVTVLGVRDERNCIQADVGIFFTEIVACCGCGDEPMAQNAYCEIEIEICKFTAEAVFRVKPG